MIRAAILPVVLLVLLAACSFLPLLASDATAKAWGIVAGGVELTGAWLAVLGLANGLPRYAAAGVRAVACIGAILAAQMLFRLGFPMDRPVRLPPGQSMGEALLGSWVWFADAALVFWGVACVDRGLRDGNRTNRR